MKPKKVIETCRKLINEWVDNLGLDGWNITVNYRTYLNPQNEPYVSPCALASAQWEYMRATIDVNLAACQDLTAAELKEVVVHELCHVMVNEMRDWTIQHEERTVTLLTNAMIQIEKKKK